MRWRPVAVAVMLLVARQEPPNRDAVVPALAAAESAALAGRHQEAISALERLLRDAGLGDDLRARALDALGASEIALGQYGSAVTHATDAAGHFGRLGDVARQGGALNRVGLARLYAAEYAEAASAFRAAVELSRGRGDLAAEAEQVTNLGNVYFFLGRYSDAAAAYDSALAVTARASGAEWAPRRRRLTLVNLATLDQRLGRDREALARYQQIDTTGADLRPREHAQILANLGVLYRRLGDPHKSLETYDRALALFERDRFLDGELGVIKNRGIVLALDLNDLGQAEAMFTRAFNRASGAGNRREVLQALIYRGETRRRLGRSTSASEDFHPALTLARELQTPEEEWKALFGLGRVDHAAGRRLEAVARFTAAIAVIEGVRERVRVPTLRSDFFSDKREVYDHLIDGLIDAGAPAARVLGVLEQSHSRAWRERLGLTSALDLVELRARLPADTTILDYWFSDLGAALIAVRRETVTLMRLDLSSADVSALSASLARSQSASWAALARRVGDALLPAGVLDGAARVAIVGDGALGLVPFEVLTVAGRPLVERVAVSYLPTAAVLLTRRDAVEAWKAPWGAVLAAFADPLIPSTSPDTSAGASARLAASAREVTDIVAETGGRSRVWTGPANQKAALEAGLGDTPILHLATHAVADGDALEQSRILFSPAAADPSRADYLYLREAYELHLDGVELAVLSACETSRGRLVRGEGVQSFSRAFLAAGARSTVTTLWRVPDGPTADFMRIFYRGLHAGLARDEALRRAKLEFLQSGTTLADPHFWAAFVLTGDGASPVPRAPKIRTLVAGVSLMAAAGAVFIGVRRRRRR